jgi:hypothetical protein
MMPCMECDETLEDHEKAFTEVSFLLDILSTTINQVVGQSTSSLGISAGKFMARKMPIYLKNPTFEDVLAALQKKLSNGFELAFTVNDQGAAVQIGRCAIREVCLNRKLAVGGQVCTLFHYYLAGICSELLGKPVKAGAAVAGQESCSFPLGFK